MQRYEDGNEEAGWWTKYYSPVELHSRIMDKMEPAKSAIERIKWASNFDLIASAILFNLNFILCTPKTAIQLKEKKGTHNWEIYAPGKSNETVVKEII